VGIALLFTAILETAHTLAYKGMDVFPEYDANLPTQLWLAWRYMQSVSFLLAPIFLQPGRRLNVQLTFAAYSVITAALLVAIFARVFPVAYVEGVGLTPFKIWGEYIISGLFVGGAGLLYYHRKHFEPAIWQLLMGSLLLAVGAELMFTRYVNVDDTANLIGHLLNIGAYYLLYRAIIEKGLRRPYDLLFRNLRQAHDELEMRVAERTHELVRSNAQLQALHDVEQAILAAQSPAAIAQGALQRLQGVLPIERAAVMLHRHDADKTELLAVEPNGHQNHPAGLLFSLSAYQMVVERGELPEEAESHAELLPPGVASLPIRLQQAPGSFLSISLDAAGAAIGSLNLWALPEQQFTGEHVAFARQVAGSLALAIRHAQLFWQVENSRRQLQDLSRRLVEVQENERRAIARELHDETGQSLTALKLGLGRLERDPACSSTLQAPIGELREITDSVLDGLHRMAMNLRPASLDRLGLEAAVKQYIQAFERRSHLPISLEVAGLNGQRYGADVETTVYRVIQEALTNIARHARASHVAVLVEVRRPDDRDSAQNQHRLIAIIEDNGVGFDVAGAMDCGRLGLLGMRERAEMLGGRLTVESSLGAGATVYLEVPCTPRPLP
jgi:signal transduction histidine kinase